ncbi:MAG: thioredoxin family protein [Prevotellaceae bacterium]|jgi:small redox-active disulfide protein 2|nr:thioredoxin family protein [Prevotellaceae bacterium]
MKIKVLGACCAACNATFENVKKAANEIDENIEVAQIDNVLEILRYKVMQTPAVVIDDVVVCAGRDLNFEEAKKLILNFRTQSKEQGIKTEYRLFNK